MGTEEILNKINEILIDEFEVEADIITPNANLKDTLGLDSLDYVDLVVTIESNFGVKLGEADFVGVKTFQDFYNVLEGKLAVKN